MPADETSLKSRALDWMASDRRQRANLLWLTLSYLVYGVGATLFGAELWTVFLRTTGFSKMEIGWIASAGTGAMAFGLLVFMGLGDRIHRRVRTASLILALLALGPVATVGVALMPRAALPLASALFAFVSIAIAQNLASSIPVMLDYPIWARALAPGVRGRLFGFTTISYGLPGIAVGILAADLLKTIPYPMGYAWCFLAAAGAMALRGACYSQVRELPEMAVEGASSSALPWASILRVLKLKEFQWLAGPHVVRGLTMSIITFTVTLGKDYMHLPEHYTGYAASATQAATMIAGIWLAGYADRVGAAWGTLLGDVLYAAGMGSVILLGGNPTIFLALYFLTQFGRQIEDNTVPLGAINIVPTEHLGAFSAARLMILMGSSAIGNPIFGWLFDHGHYVIVFAIGAVLKLLSGLWFFYIFRLKPAGRGEVPEVPTEAPRERLG